MLLMLRNMTSLSASVVMMFSEVLNAPEICSSSLVQEPLVLALHVCRCLSLQFGDQSTFSLMIKMKSGRGNERALCCVD